MVREVKASWPSTSNGALRKERWTLALDITLGEPATDLAVRVLSVAAADGDEQPVAVEVTGGGIRDVVLINPGGGRLRAGPFELNGQGAALRYRDGQLEQTLVVGDAAVRVAGE